jgi:hypothetical protein
MVIDFELNISTEQIALDSANRPAPKRQNLQAVNWKSGNLAKPKTSNPDQRMLQNMLSTFLEKYAKPCKAHYIN